MKIIDLTRPEENRWSYLEHKTIIFTDSDEVVCEVELGEKEATLRARTFCEVHAFLARPARGIRVLPGEYIVLHCADCFGFRKNKSIRWFMAFSTSERLKRMIKIKEVLVEENGTFLV